MPPPPRRQQQQQQQSNDEDSNNGNTKHSKNENGGQRSRATEAAVSSSYVSSHPRGNQVEAHDIAWQGWTRISVLHFRSFRQVMISIVVFPYHPKNQVSFVVVHDTQALIGLLGTRVGRKITPVSSLHALTSLSPQFCMPRRRMFCKSRWHDISVCTRVLVVDLLSSLLEFDIIDTAM